jgi:hypothetical protein
MVRDVSPTAVGAVLILVLFRIWYPIEDWTIAIAAILAALFAAIRFHLMAVG